MAYLNKIDINGRTYYLQHLTDGTNEARLPTPAKDDELLLRSQVVNSVTSSASQSGTRVPLSAYQGYLLNSKLNNEILDREADVDEEQARAEAAELVLTNNLNQEIQDRIDDVDSEERRALAAEKILTDNLAQEIVDRINDVNEEQQRAENAEQVLTNNLNKEIQDRIDNVNAEETRALAAEKVLTDNLNQEIQNRINDVDAEEVRASAAEKVLTDNLLQEVSDRANAVTAEQNRATSKENEIIAALTTETNRAKAAEETNATAIATEKSRAEGIEANHESRIATMEIFFKEADIDASQEFIDTLKEIQTYIADDKTGAATMAASIQLNKMAIETEARTARAAEKANADAIAVLNSSTDGSVVKAVADAKSELEVEISNKLDKTDKYVHPSYDIATSGLYKIAVDAFGHVSSVIAVTKEDIVDLGIPGQDTTYDDVIASLQQQINDLKALVESCHPATEPDEPGLDEVEPDETE